MVYGLSDPTAGGCDLLGASSERFHVLLRGNAVAKEGLDASMQVAMSLVRIES